MSTGSIEDRQHMSGFESLMWELERDPQLSSAFANLTLFDRPPERARFRARMDRATLAVPRLRQRVVTPKNPIEHPEWVDDPDFDLDHHLRWVDLGGSATTRDLHRLAATLSRQPFDRERPLWEFVTIEGLADGRAAMLQRLHHTITDGEGGIRLSVQFLDFERDPEPKPSRPPRSDAKRSTPAASGDAATGEEEPVASWWGLPRHGAELSAMARSTLRQVRVGQRRSSLWTERSLHRWFGVTELSLEDVLAASRALGGSVNDLFITGAAAAAGRVHDLAGHSVDQLRVSMPVSTRHDRSAGGNAFSPTQTLVPTGVMDPTERFLAIHTALSEVKEERAIDAMEGAANAASLMPSAAILRTGQHLAGAVDFVCSNVRAAPFDLFIGGAFMEANYPLGPLAGTAFNLTTMSYRGWLFLGLLADPAAIDDPQQLLDELERSYAELMHVAGIKPGRRP